MKISAINSIIKKPTKQTKQSNPFFEPLQKENFYSNKINSNYYKQYAISFKGNDDIDKENADGEDFNEEEIKKSIAQFMQFLDEEQNIHEEIITNIISSYINEINDFYAEPKDSLQIVVESFISSLKMSAETLLAGSDENQEIPHFYSLPLKEMLKDLRQNCYSEETFNAILEHPQLKEGLDLLQRGTDFKYMQLLESGYSKDPLATLNILAGKLLRFAELSNKYVNGELIDIYSLFEEKYYVRKNTEGQIQKIVTATVLQNSEEAVNTVVDFNSDGSIKTIESYSSEGDIFFKAEFQENKIKITSQDLSNDTREKTIKYFHRLDRNNYKEIQ